MKAMDYVNSKYIRELAAKDVREDGRKAYDFRSIKVSSGIIKNAEGSSQVDLGLTRVMVGIKMIVDTPMEDTPDMGNLVVSAEMLPLADPEYEPGPPTPEAIELARVIDRGIRAAEYIDLHSLLIEEGKAWSVYLDIYILNNDGNLFDAGMLAALAAIADAKMPGYKEGKAVMNERIKPLPLGKAVSSCTFVKLGGKIFLDPNSSEEKAADARLTIETDGKVIRAMQKGMSGSFTKEEIETMIDTAMEKHAVLSVHTK
jgi:exosome complex component RRP42